MPTGPITNGAFRDIAEGSVTHLVNLNVGLLSAHGDGVPHRSAKPATPATLRPRLCEGTKCCLNSSPESTLTDTLQRSPRRQDSRDAASVTMGWDDARCELGSKLVLQGIRSQTAAGAAASKTRRSDCGAMATRRVAELRLRGLASIKGRRSSLCKVLDVANTCKSYATMLVDQPA